MKSRFFLITGVLLFLSLFLIVFSSAMGASDIEAPVVFNALIRLISSGIPEPYQISEPSARILFFLRFPRVLLSFLVGMVLGGAGVVYQGVFRNPMADPYVLGISSGASLGAAVAIFVLPGDWIPFSLMGFAFLGGVCVLLVVYGLAGSSRRSNTNSLLLTGIAVAMLVNAFLSLLLTFSRDRVGDVFFWMMGSFVTSSWDKVIWILPVVIIMFFLLILWSRELDILSLGDEVALSLGLDADKQRFLMLAVVSVAVSAAVALSGPIGFIGLIVPHIVRRIFGPSHKKLVVFSILTGGISLLICDTVARSIFPPVEFPVGVISSLLGAPFFLYLLKRGRASVL
ncbi:iron ABC transporter permease [Spirochaetia bacterium 38H-sp]|uniref:Iron ABC transporter permease n=1 Tax=Rarispira pelagica TaxID=3141764 RepID=A0ABU9U8G8_9SPIR